jgi:hypothetical protein
MNGYVLLLAGREIWWVRSIVMVRDWHRARARVLGGILVVILAR